MYTSTEVACYGLIFMLNSIQYGFILCFGGYPIEEFKRKYPNWDFNKEAKNITYFNNFLSIFGSIGGFLICLLVHLTDSKKSVFYFNIANCLIWLLYFFFTPKLFVFGIVLRSLQGVLMGGLASITPILMTDISPNDIVGMLGCLNQFGILLGMIIFTIIGSHVKFNVLAIIGAIETLVSAGLIWIVPTDIIKKEKLKVLFNRTNRKKLIIGMLAMAFQQFCVNPYLDNLGDILADTGIYIDESMQSVLVSAAQLVSVLIAAFNMDGIGRRKMWAFSSCGIILSQVLFIVCMSTKNDDFIWVLALCVFIYMLSFGHGLGPIPWFIAHDLFPKEIRLEGQSFIAFVNMLCSIGINVMYTDIKEKIKETYFMIIFMCITIWAIPFGLYFIPKKRVLNDEILTLI